jgi:hypothetical protein
LGAEYRFSGGMAACVESGMKYLQLPRTDTSWIPSEGYTLRVELKRYFDDGSGFGSNVYLALEYRWILDRSTFTIDYHIEQADSTQTTDPKPTLVDEFGVIERVQVANFKIGKVFIINDHLYLDAYTGLGIRWRDVVNTHREFRDDPSYVLDARHPGKWMTVLEGPGQKSKIANLSLGFKLGWRF